MTGPEHYREAELLLDIDPDDREHSRALTARAQAHATLALTAATALGIPNETPMPTRQFDAWLEMAS